MLFNSYFFIFIYLPITLTLYFFISNRFNEFYSRVWLVLASLFFYAYWNPVYVIIIISSMIVNFYFGHFLQTRKNNKTIFVLGIFLNMAVLIYFKYSFFVMTNLKSIFSFSYEPVKIFLPLAISFFTFQQIAYLVDTYRGETKEYSFIDYCLFVSFFPQLIAGPIVHHKEILPQFYIKENFKISAENISVGISIFIFGLFKKVILADWISSYASPVFENANTGNEMYIFDSWVAAISYTFQLYFDFSGYSDMAIGLARLFGIILPENFHSPYKSVNIIEFWRRWHITLSRFLRDYLYISLGGNRKGEFNRYVNLFITMLLGGLWHGAGWNFLFWGGLHGFYLIINNLWIKLLKTFSIEIPQIIYKPFSILLTFISVMFAWIFFRATSFESAILIIQSMFGVGQIKFTDLVYAVQIKQVCILVFFFLVTWFFPNTNQIFSKNKYSLETNSEIKSILHWQPNTKWAIIFVLVCIVSILGVSTKSEFLYFQF